LVGHAESEFRKIPYLALLPFLCVFLTSPPSDFSSERAGDVADRAMLRFAALQVMKTFSLLFGAGWDEIEDYLFPFPHLVFSLDLRPYFVNHRGSRLLQITVHHHVSHTTFFFFFAFYVT